MKFLLFKLRLIFYLGVFLLRLTANFSNKAKPVIIGLFVTGLLVLIGGISLLNTVQKPIQAVSTIVPKNTQLYELNSLTDEEIKSRIAFWEQVSQTQPHSRDVLLNLSHLYSALGLDEKAAEYKNSAVNIDPNNPLFE